jgi:hypothetical protein
MLCAHASIMYAATQLVWHVHQAWLILLCYHRAAAAAAAAAAAQAMLTSCQC